MGRIWNLRTKLIGVLVLVLTGTFLLQTAIYEHNEQQLLLELEKLAQDIVQETGELITGRMGSQLARLGIASSPHSPVFRSRESAAPGDSGELRVSLIWNEMAPGSARTPVSTRARASGSPRPKVVRTVQIQMILPEFIDLVAEMAQSPEATTHPTDRQMEILRLLEWRTLIQAGVAPPAPLPTPVEAPMLVPDDIVPVALLESLSAFSEPAASPAPLVAAAEESTPPTLDVTPHIDRIQELFNASKRHDLIATVGVFLIGIALAWFLGVRVTRPVDEVVQGFRSLAEGDFEARVPERPGEEFGHLGRQFNAMVARLSEGRELERELSQRERIQHMGDLAAGVAHDVRNPLNAIHLNIGQIRDEFVPADERSRERFLRFTSDVQHEVERLNQLVTNFLSLAQPAAREAEPVDPNELIDELSRLLRKEATGRRVELSLHLAERLPHFTWNRQEMKSAFLNIAINALQALGDGGGALSVTTARREGRRGPELAVTFADDGPGIPPEDLERVFVPYYTTRKGGTGLGMAIARRTAERHGGRIELRSTVGEGTTVTFAFPYPAGEVSA